MAVTTLVGFDEDTGCPTEFAFGNPGQVLEVQDDGSLGWETHATDLDIDGTTLTYVRYDGTVVNFDLCTPVNLCIVDDDDCPAILVDSPNTCAAGGLGADYMLRSATFNQANCTLTLAGAPEHTTVNDTVFAQFQTVDPANGVEIVQTLSLTLMNPDPCRDMAYLVVMRAGRTGVTITPGNRWQFEQAQTGPSPDLLGTGTMARFDNRFGAGPVNVAYPSDAQFYTGTIPPGGTATYSYTVTFRIDDFVNDAANRANIGRGYISYIASTV